VVWDILLLASISLFRIRSGILLHIILSQFLFSSDYSAQWEFGQPTFTPTYFEDNWFIEINSGILWHFLWSLKWERYWQNKVFLNGKIIAEMLIFMAAQHYCTFPWCSALFKFISFQTFQTSWWQKRKIHVILKLYFIESMVEFDLRHFGSKNYFFPQYPYLYGYP